MQVKISVTGQAVMSGNQEALIVEKVVETRRLEQEDLIEDLRSAKTVILEEGHQIGKVQVGRVMVEDLVVVEVIKSSILEDDLRLKRTQRTRGLIS